MVSTPLRYVRPALVSMLALAALLVCLILLAFAGQAASLSGEKTAADTVELAGKKTVSGTPKRR